jgi:outer membrane protein assembly factor BamB
MHAHPMNQPRRTRPPRISSPFAIGLALGVAVLVALNLRPDGSSPATHPPTESAGGSSGAIAVGGTAATAPTAVVPGGPGETLAPSPAASPPATAGTGPFPGGILIADRANARIIVVNNAGRIVWKFPAAGSLPSGWKAVNADDAFMAPDGKSIVANDESHETIVRIDLATKRVVWSYGHYGQMGSGAGFLHTPDDAYPLPNGDIVVADIENCRILEIAPDKSIVRQWGRTGVCSNAVKGAFARPNGDTPLPDGGVLITEIGGSRVVRLSASGKVVFDIHVPVAYPSDAQLDAQGNVVVADFSSIGQVVAVNPRTGVVIWRWRYPSGNRRLDHPSLATPLPGGLVSVNDDFRQRVVVIDPLRHRIVWQFGRTDVAGHGSLLLNDPDGHQPLPADGPFGSA